MHKNKPLTERTTFLEENFLSTGSFFQTLGKFNHQTFKKGLIQTNAFSKSLIKNTSQLRRKKV